MPNEGPSPKRQAELQRAQETRTKVIARLEDEDEILLANKLRNCSTLFRLTCGHCGSWKEVEKGCRNKWCPVCVRRIAAKRSAKYAAAVAMMQWPLFITLTVPHDDTPPLQQLRRLRRAFGKLRHTKLWKTRTVGGVAGLEVNSRSGEFHPHLHAVIDCKWLAWHTRPPQRGDSRAAIKAKCRAASDELGLTWARCLGIKSIDPDWCGVIFKAKRCTQEGITTEILKYSIKGSDLVESEQPIGPIIQALQATRLVTSFGTLFGKRRFDDGAKEHDRSCQKCGETAWVTDWEADAACRSSRPGGKR